MAVELDCDLPKIVNTQNQIKMKNIDNLEFINKFKEMVMIGMDKDRPEDIEFPPIIKAKKK